jgi:hypothetical protein
LRYASDDDDAASAADNASAADAGSTFGRRHI